MSGQKQTSISELPKSVKRRVQALKKLQLDAINVSTEFFEVIHKLSIEFSTKFDALYARRRDIVTGRYEPTDEEVDIPLFHGATEEEIKAMNNASAPEPAEGTKGIPDFWLNLMKNSELVSKMITEQDEPILKHLYDITVEMGTNPNSFALIFHFTPNEYFQQTELKKWYALRISADPEDPFAYDGPEIVDAKGTVISWNEGKNVTEKVVSKKAKSGEYAGKIVKNTAKAVSFFNFFDSPNVKTPDASGDSSFDIMESLYDDAEIGMEFRDRIVPRAVLYYTGETSDFEEYDTEEDESGRSDTSDGQ